MKKQKQRLTIVAEQMPHFWHCAIYAEGANEPLHVCQVSATDEAGAKEKAFEEFESKGGAR